jgi:ABC-type uncharacterized transport system permease subunit
MLLSEKTRNLFAESLQIITAVVVGLSLGLVCTLFAGENPFHVVSILYRSAFGSWYDLGMTLFYTSSLVFTGLSVMVAFRAGLFNVGAEGQLTIGAMACTCVGIFFPHLPAPWSVLFSIMAAWVGGGLWALIAAWLKVARGCHEVISTIMLNFMATGLCYWLTLDIFKNPHSQNPETVEIPSSFLLKPWAIFDGAPIGHTLILCLLLVILCGIFLKYTLWGYKLRAVGHNPKAAEVAGIHSSRYILLAFFLSGALAGTVGVGEVLGNAGKFRIGFSSGLGFMGIAVALLGKSRPVGVLLSAFLFGILHKGTGDLDFETEHISRELSLILQSIVILTVLALTKTPWRWKKKKETADV